MCLYTGDAEAPTAAERRASMTWAQRLRRMFSIDRETCPACGGAVRITASIEDPVATEKILNHLAENGGSAEVCLANCGSRATGRSWSPW